MKSSKNKLVLDVFKNADKIKKLGKCSSCQKPEMPIYSLQTHNLFYNRCSICNIKELLEMFWLTKDLDSLKNMLQPKIELNKI